MVLQLKIIITQILYYRLWCLWHQYHLYEWKLADFRRIHQSLYPLTSIQNNIFKQNTVMIPHKTYIPHLFSLFSKPKYSAVGSFSWYYFPPSSLLCIIFSSVYTIWTLCAFVYVCLVVTCWEGADLLALVFGVELWVCHFPIGILGQVWYLIV